MGVRWHPEFHCGNGAALVTAFGGPHSHMALRCAELACPAVLGLGPERFRRVAGAGGMRIDFDRSSLEPIDP